MTRTATASFLPLSTTVAALSCALGVLLGCNSSGGGVTSPESGTVPCPANVASQSGNAAKLTSGTGVENKICYERSSNWYYINVPSGSTLLDVQAGYSSAANTTVQLDVKVYYKTNSTTLTLVQDLLAPSQGDGGSDSIDTTVHAVQAGDYYLQIADAHNVNFDATNAYKLNVDYAVDPDTHEPNDTPAQAKPTDSKPGWIAYLGDLDIFKTSAANANDLVTIDLDVPLKAASPINYAVTSSSGTVLYSDLAEPQAKPLKTQISVPAAGTYYLTLTDPTGGMPSHDPSSAYTIAFASRSNPDTIDNHSIANATCPAGGTGPCNMPFSGSKITYPTQMSYITVPGQHDYYRIDMTSASAAVLQINLKSSASTTVKYAIDLLTPDPKSPCSANSDCEAMNQRCNFGVNDAGVSTTTDCELSHACLPPGDYSFCKSSPCSLCQGAGLCIPPSGTSSGTGQCAVPQYLSSFSPKGIKLGGPSVSTAQPLFDAGVYYVSVHDASSMATDLMQPYSLDLVVVPEPDIYDQSAVPANRNNFYDPYPSSMSDPQPNKSRAVDITSQLTSGTPVIGWISYESDNDWFSFKHPCPGMNCALDFQWTQPGPSPVHVVFYMLEEDLGFHESFSYTGGSTTKLTMPVTSSFDNQSCGQCSFAGAVTGQGGPATTAGYTYYLRIADDSQTDWDFSAGGQYSLTVTKGADGCPAACDVPKGKQTKGCYCYCASSMSCPSPKF